MRSHGSGRPGGEMGFPLPGSANHQKGDREMRIGLRCVRGSCRALLWAAAIGVGLAVGVVPAVAQIDATESSGLFVPGEMSIKLGVREPAR